jgi:hypothetical protein
MVNQFPVLSSRLSLLRARVLLGTENRELGTDFLVCFPPMWGAYRWAAKFLLLVVLVPSFGPLTMACAAQAQKTHCLPKSAAVQSEQSAMSCHHAIALAKRPQPTTPFESSEVSFQSNNDSDCCHDHCCCGATTSEWAQPASNLVSFLHLLTEPARPSQTAPSESRGIFEIDSARAPPRG